METAIATALLAMVALACYKVFTAVLDSTNAANRGQNAQADLDRLFSDVTKDWMNRIPGQFAINSSSVFSSTGSSSCTDTVQTAPCNNLTIKEDMANLSGQMTVTYTTSCVTPSISKGTGMLPTGIQCPTPQVPVVTRTQVAGAITTTTSYPASDASLLVSACFKQIVDCSSNPLQVVVEAYSVYLGVNNTSTLLAGRRGLAVQDKGTGVEILPSY